MGLLNSILLEVSPSVNFSSFEPSFDELLTNFCNNHQLGPELIFFPFSDHISISFMVPRTFGNPNTILIHGITFHSKVLYWPSNSRFSAPADLKDITVVESESKSLILQFISSSTSLHLHWTKQKCLNSQFAACGQTVLSDRSILITRQNLMENAKIKNSNTTFLAFLGIFKQCGVA